VFHIPINSSGVNLNAKGVLEAIPGGYAVCAAVAVAKGFAATGVAATGGAATGGAATGFAAAAGVTVFAAMPAALGG
tara:strand:- start:121 stop:351 length:231 start_codon:yes stop_codon:yes gene_type:complete